MISMLAMTLVTGLVATPAIDATHRAEIEETLRGFAQAGDRQDVVRLQYVLHDDFRVVFVTHGKPGVSTLDRATYAKLLKAKKLGGVPRTFKLTDMSIKSGIATTHSELQSEAAHFEVTSTLIREAAGWRIIQEAVHYTPVKS